MILLETENVTRRFGSLRAVDDVSIQIRAGERRALIGPNGAGKSTLFHIISGRFRPDSGSVRFMGAEIGGMAPHRIARLGISRSFQITNIFPALSVRENFRLAVQAGRHHRPRPGRGHPQSAPEIVTRAEELLVRMKLEAHGNDMAGALSYGDQRRVEIGLTLAAEPVLVLFDEPTAGMARSAAEEIIELLQTIPREVTMVLIDHDLDVVFRLSDRITVMRNGAVLAEGSPSEIERDERVQEAYFGAATQYARRNE